MKTKGIIAGLGFFTVASIVITAVNCGNQSLSVGIFTALFDNLGTWFAFGGYIAAEAIALVFSAMIAGAISEV